MSLPPAQPTYILRGHEAQIHAVRFIRNNSRLVTGDADGWLVIWSLATKRPVASWQAHQGTILGVEAWGTEKIISHGKDNKLIVWQLGTTDEDSLSTALPFEGVGQDHKKPWVLHILTVNTMNFCSFALCNAGSEVQRAYSNESNQRSEEKMKEDILIAVPNTLSSETVDIFHLPSERRIHMVPKDKTLKTGMLMAVQLFWKDGYLTVISGFESGHIITSILQDELWVTRYTSQPHTQPVLSLDADPSLSYCLSSSADALLVQHPIPGASPSSTSGPVVTSSEEKNTHSKPPPQISAPSGLSQMFAQASSTTPGQSSESTRPLAATTCEMTSLKVTNTKHSGQQSLRIRSDSRLFATAGWDTKIRVYSAKTLKELAVLKWHREGCYAVDFAAITGTEPTESLSAATSGANQSQHQSAAVVPRVTTINVREKRIRKAETTHWLAAGSKDGKVSLWDIY